KGLSTSLRGKGGLAVKLPAFAFDGTAETKIRCDGKRLSVRYRGWECAYETDGEIADTGTVCYNRNGRYRVFEARGNDVLCVKVEIRSIGQ
nr:hypothetical protein [Kiritimatiellia bacterium]